jgi:hypothetical protein
MGTQRGITAHLRGRPHILTKKEIDRLKQWAEALDLVDSNDEILALPSIPNDSPPIEALGKPRSGGFRCIFTTDCRGMAVALIQISTCRKKKVYCQEINKREKVLMRGGV